jgi:RNA polymerase sigma factor (sigma-70 family)
MGGVGQTPFEALVGQLDIALRRYLRRLVAPSDIDDVVLAALVLVWSHFDEVPVGAEAAWACAAAKRLVWNERRRRRRSTALVARMEAGLLITRTEEDLDHRSAAVEVFNSLNPAARQVLVLRAGGHTTHQIAAELGLSVEAARKRIARARHQLGSRLP